MFAEDGVTATLNTPEMVSALTFLKGLKFTDQVMPAEADYNVADGMFKNGAPGATPADPAASLAPVRDPSADRRGGRRSSTATGRSVSTPSCSVTS